MPSNLNVVLGLNMQVVDNTATTTPVNSVNPGITLGATDQSYYRYLQVTTGGITLPLTNATVWVLYVRNMGTNVVTVAYTPTSGSPQSINLCPVTNGYGGVFLYFNTVETGNGITAVTLTAAGGTTPVEALVAW